MKVYIGRYRKDDKPRKIDIRIDKWDTWGMDNTLALIIHPMLIQLKATKHGSPSVDDEDVPEELRSTAAPKPEQEWETDDKFHQRWEWVMDEMIFAMKEIAEDHKGEDEFWKDYGEIQLEERADESVEMKWKREPVYDKEGLDKYHERVQRGCVLFGKYFQNLWD